jgi:hypothetical protein
MEKTEVVAVVERVAALVTERYVFPEAAGEVAGVLAKNLAAGAYGTDEAALAAAVTADLQSVNGDKHLRLLHHLEPLPDSHGEDETDLATMTAWARRTAGGVGRAECLPANIGYLDIRPILFPSAIGGDSIGAAMSLLASTEALILDLRHCLGGEPTMVAFLCSYLFGPEPVELTGLFARGRDRVNQSWTLPYVPGRRFGAGPPVYVLTSATTFSGGEQLGYDLQQRGRATVVGERTRGGAHAREGFRVHPHLEATISVARAVHPVTGGNWEGTGVTPDVAVPAAEARSVAYRLALEWLVREGRGDVAEARRLLAESSAPPEPAALPGRARDL